MHEYMSDLRVWVVTCRDIPEEIPRVRLFVREIFEGDPWADDVALIVTELGTNALTHANGGFRLTLVRSSEGIAIAVADKGGTTTRPHIPRPEADSPGGRGLALVHAYAHIVTIDGDHRGHTVTAELRFKEWRHRAC
ncbi:ATP-binding protein [Streptomyces litchfieldiae]|uniref:ATP-binding protein n=1 Tax=Streptomyces litchfieldiae TaxID=3075543 RepID=A0ABU2MLA9_9ACTN|nr:ATP-binding protein [Streptomyces sp. DSM 44938]MDT0341909.1 ATP-binding protein [Streptomyces sp. DSM 44938]